MKLVKKLFKKWMGIARIIGSFQSQVLLSLFYLILLSFIGVIFRRKDPLGFRSKNLKKGSQFEKWNHPPDSLRMARKQF